MEYNELSRQELIGYLMDFVEGLEQHTLDADEQGFVELHKKSSGSFVMTGSIW